MADVLAAVLLALILLLFAGIVIAFLVVAGWFLYAVVAVARGRRPPGRLRAAAAGGRARPGPANAQARQELPRDHHLPRRARS